MNKKKFTYKRAGVDIEKGEEFSRWIKKKSSSLTSPSVLSGIGSFSGLYSLNKEKGKGLILAATTDGVGTKLRIAQQANKHNSIGIDLVAMSVNDLLAEGAKPLFFLDYISTSKLSLTIGKQIISGIIEGCKRAGCILLGGETAEMPSFYKEGDYDVAGFAVGIIKKERLIDKSKIKPGDKILGIPSSGLHSNGFSLVRKIFFEDGDYHLKDRIEELGRTLGEELLEPTRIYTSQISHLLNNFYIKGIANITGGGMTRNISRILPSGCRALIYKGSWKIHPIFKLIQREGKVSEEEMFKVFNMGIGMALIIPSYEESSILKFCANQKEKVKIIGEIVKGEKDVEIKHHPL